MRRGRSGSIVASPVLVGAVTALVTVVAVFLAYNANSGLPFVPTYELRAVVPDASELTLGNDVRVGGTRVGQVEAIDAQLRAGRPVAVLRLEVEEALEPLRDDTRLLIRQRSNVGLKYVELVPGTRGRPLRSGGALPLEQATEPVDLDDSLATYDAPTRAALQGLLRDFGGGVAGRGDALNRSLGALPEVFDDLTVVGRVLSGPRADLEGFVDGTAAAAAAVAPVAGTLGDLFDTGATTFGAIAAEGDAFGRFFEEAAALERDGTPAFRATRPVLAQAAALAREARPGVAVLPATSRRIALGLRRTGPALDRSQAIAAPLDRTVGTLRTLSRDPDTTGSLQRLTDVVRSLVPTLQHLNPIQTVCNAFGIWTRNVPSVVSEGDATGTWFRFIQMQKRDESEPIAEPAPDLHYYTIPDAGQGGECEAGNESYEPGQRIGRVPGVQPGATEDTARGTLAQRVAAEGPQR